MRVACSHNEHIVWDWLEGNKGAMHVNTQYTMNTTYAKNTHVVTCVLYSTNQYVAHVKTICIGGQ